MLTPRQKQVAALVAKGMSYREIAPRLGMAPETVRTHIKQAAIRLGGDSRQRSRLTIWFFGQSGPDHNSAA